jgi:diguanylate cyclase (GGDEF)-like protein/PAS domain S-box-containing protein
MQILTDAGSEPLQEVIAGLRHENRLLGDSLSEARQALATRNSQFLGVIENLPHGLIICDKHHRILVTNARFNDIYGVSVDDVAPGMPLDDLVALVAQRGMFSAGNVFIPAQELLRDLAPGVIIERSWKLSGGRIIAFSINGLQGGGWIALHRDVTEEYLSSKRIAESEQRFRDFASAAHDWCWETDAEHRYIDPATFLGREAQFGAADYVGKRRIDLPILAEDRPVLEAHMLDLEARRPFENMVYRIPNEDGSITWISASGKPNFDRKGRFLGYRGLSRDVTAQETHRQKLTEMMDTFRDFAEAASDWFWETDQKHRFCSFSDTLYLLAGLQGQSLMGKTRLDLDFHPSDRPALEANRRIIEAKEPFKDLLYRIHSEENGWVWIKAGGKPVHDSQGRFLGYRGSASNVSEEMNKRERIASQQRALERSEAVAHLGHWRQTLADGQVEWSGSLFDILGFKRDTKAPALACLIRKIVPADRPAFLAMHRELAAGAPIEHHEYRIRPRPEQEIRHLRLRIDLERDDRGALRGIFGIVQDITDIKLADALLKERTEQLQAAQRIGKFADWSEPAGSDIQWWSNELYELLHYSAGSIVPQWRNLLVDDDRGEIAKTMAAAASGEIAKCDIKLRRGDGETGDFELAVRTIRSEKGEWLGLSGTLQDITERKSAERQLAQLAFYDPLTGLANRALFRRELEQLVQRSLKNNVTGALLLIDLDRFKEVNDTLGHAAGDELLRKVSGRIGRVLGAEHFLARLGGDEFAVIIETCTKAQACDLAGAIVEAVGSTIQLERGEVVIGASIGIVLASKDGRNAEELLRHADLALYRAKEDGRGRFVCFNVAMNTLVQQKMVLARDLREALTSGTGLETRFQPQIDLAANRVAGFETLLRWKHPTRGYIPPTEFVPIAESSSLIGGLGLWVLNAAVLQAKAWLDAGEPPRQIAVNVSAAQIWQTDLEADVARILAETQLPPHLLCLELTESLFADHSEARVRKALTALKQLGVTLALDDFGTGYSSLGYLTQLPFDKLKIDRVFVDGIVDSDRKRNLVKGIAALGKGLGMSVVAEGAEKWEEVTLLRGFGCDEVQGYVFARPEIAETALAFANEFDSAAVAKPENKPAVCFFDAASFEALGGSIGEMRLYQLIQRFRETLQTQLADAAPEALRANVQMLASAAALLGYRQIEAALQDILTALEQKHDLAQPLAHLLVTRMAVLDHMREELPALMPMARQAALG